MQSNDSVWFCNFDWLNGRKAAVKLEIDISWTETGGNSFVFFDTWLENSLYVTIGLRQDRKGLQNANMSVFHDSENVQSKEAFMKLLTQKPLACEGFLPFRGSENDVYYIGNFPFKIGEWYRLIIVANYDQVEGFIYRWSNQKLIKLGTFLTGKDSIIKARKDSEATNGVALEHYGMDNSCKCKSSILIRNPLREDIEGVKTSASRGRIVYQKCPNANVNIDSKSRIILSHGGNTIKRRESGWLLWLPERILSFNMPLDKCKYDYRWETWSNL